MMEDSQPHQNVTIYAGGGGGGGGGGQRVSSRMGETEPPMGYD